MSNRPDRGVAQRAGRALALALVATSSALAAEGPGPPPQILLLRPPGDATGLVRVGAITNSTAVDYVAFFVDDFLVAAAHSPPYDAQVDLGQGGRPRTLRAVGFNRSAEPLAEATYTFGDERPSVGIEIVEMEALADSRRIGASVRVDLPPGTRLRHVDYYWNDRFAARRPEPPFSVELDAGARSPGDHLRAVAVLADGSEIETARLADPEVSGDRLEVNLVQLYAVVTDRLNRPQSHLLPTDFTISAAGSVHSIERFSVADDVPLSLGLAIDSSDSMKPWMEEARAAAATFFETTLGERDRAFLVEFADRPRLAQALTGDPAALARRLEEVELGGDTAFYDAILFSIAQFQGVGGRKALVVLTDGEDLGSHFRPEHCIEQALAHGVQVYVIELGDPMESARRPLAILNRRIVKETGGRLYHYATGRDLEEIYGEIRSELRSQYLLAWSADHRLTEGELRKVRVRVRDPKLSVRALPAHHVQRN